MKQALAIFAKTPIPGLVKTRLTPPLSPEEGSDLYRCMLLDTVNRVRTLQIDTFIFFEGDLRFFRDAFPGLPLIPQQTCDLGGRLETAFTTLSALGYGAQVVIGSDAPDLPLSFIREAFGQLGAGRDAVFGPAEDGGYYLVGLKGAYQGIFRDIPWSSAQVLETSLERAHESGLQAALLPGWYDVDAYQDLCRPALCDPSNGAPLTRRFLGERGIGVGAGAAPTA
jgi:uncharacterized protein